jgi:Ca-activated chloride channel family protein
MQQRTANRRNVEKESTRKGSTMKRILLPGILLVAIVVAAALGFSAADATSGALIVDVSDKSGPLPGAIVTISHDTGFVKTTPIQSDVHGRAMFPVLRPGRGYIIEVSMAGFATQRFTDIRVRVGDEQIIRVVLSQVRVDSSVFKLKRRQKRDLDSLGYVAGTSAPGRSYQQSFVMEPGTPTPPPSPGVEREHNTESYDSINEHGFRPVNAAPLSTFSIDVDTASYSNVRRFLEQGHMPPPGAVRIEELINYFDYGYMRPEGDVPFGLDVEIADAPWNPEHRLARIGLKGRELAPGQRPPCNLVFLLDVSGSMRAANKLPLVQRSMKMLVNELNARDQVSIVVYAGAAGLVLPPTEAADRSAIHEAIDGLAAGGSTAGGAGIQLAYQEARKAFIEGGVNRIVLATDGDFNVGVSDRSSLIRLVETEAARGVALTTLGFGMGNYKDSMLEQLADHGNGNHAYIDSFSEARKVLVEESGGTLVTIAKDVKIQVEFNPAVVSAYRLIGYENRALNDEDFNDDTKDAGEIGAGHTVTALYEIVPRGVDLETPGVDPLKYRKTPETPENASAEMFTVKVRWKAPGGDTSKKIELAVNDDGKRLSAASDDLRFAAAVAGFGMLLRDSEHKQEFTFDDVIALAEDGLRGDRHGHRTGFVDLVSRAKRIR